MLYPPAPLRTAAGAGVLPQWVAGLGVQNLHGVGCNRSSEPLCPVMGSPAPGGDEGPGRRPAGQSPVRRGRAEPPTLLAVAPGRVTACAGSPPPELQQANSSRQSRGDRGIVLPATQAERCSEGTWCS